MGGASSGPAIPTVPRWPGSGVIALHRKKLDHIAKGHLAECELYDYVYFGAITTEKRTVFRP